MYCSSFFESVITTVIIAKLRYLLVVVVTKQHCILELLTCYINFGAVFNLTLLNAVIIKIIMFEGHCFEALTV
jgi:hypothetical protein